MTQWQYKFWQKEYKKTLSVMLALVLLQGGVRVEAATQHHTLDEFGYLETVYDNSNGLDSSAANDVVQTEDGFIWIGTYNGQTRPEYDAE